METTTSGDTYPCIFCDPPADFRTTSLSAYFRHRAQKHGIGCKGCFKDTVMLSGGYCKDCLMDRAERLLRDMNHA